MRRWISPTCLKHDGPACLAPIFDEPMPEAGREPVGSCLGQWQRPHEVGEVAGQRMNLGLGGVGGEKGASRPRPLHRALMPARHRMVTIYECVLVNKLTARDVVKPSVSLNSQPKGGLSVANCFQSCLRRTLDRPNFVIVCGAKNAEPS
jgi:hypothetical protein